MENKGSAGFWLAMFVASGVMATGNLAGWWTLSWWLVTAPLWFPYALALGVMGLMFGFMLCILALCFMVGIGALAIEASQNQNNERDNDNE